MQSPPLELVLDVVHLGARNLLRNRGDADGDTISEITRSVKDQIPYGDQVLAVALAALAAGYWVHICRPRT
ncbi:hypothetical protein EFK50_00955 [Nocardioides marmoriginsengisoli]|uniref:Uncharacterized protein n=1 Tax=Nocardioides marmoriginsengisoli TaxID=661483 RepID=A0A3N0CS06_9ACTN|nr:hypothetical protein [Nocardioides marmoriginsengisoli]RNL66225.1 hypothetical protein EFK50_00955 [Nocardioides marmoriginsengisoli]